MKIYEVKQTMIEKGIPAETMERFVFPEPETGTPEEKIDFVNQMDGLLTREHILSIMEEQGCEKYIHESGFDLIKKLEGKSAEDRIKALNMIDMSEQPDYRRNDDGTLSVFWSFGEPGKYKCVCPIMNKQPASASVSITFCGCCSGHIKYHFEQDLEVKLHLVETVSSPISSNGEKHCEHRYEIL